jgi:hypothetical protein
LAQPGLVTLQHHQPLQPQGIPSVALSFVSLSENSWPCVICMQFFTCVTCYN